MFNTESNSVEPEVVVCDVCRTIPISHLSFDAAEPIGGWLSFFAERGIEVVEDDLGRPAVPRQILGELLTERREREARLAAEQARKAESLKPSLVGGGVPAVEGMDAHESMMAAPGYTTVREEFGRPAPTFLDDMLAEGRRADAAKRAEAEMLKKAQRVLEGRDA